MVELGSSTEIHRHVIIASLARVTSFQANHFDFQNSIFHQASSFATSHHLHQIIHSQSSQSSQRFLTRQYLSNQYVLPKSLKPFEAVSRQWPMRQAREMRWCLLSPQKIPMLPQSPRPRCQKAPAVAMVFRMELFPRNQSRLPV